MRRTDAELQQIAWDSSTVVGGGCYCPSVTAGIFRAIHGTNNCTENILIGREMQMTPWLGGFRGNDEQAMVDILGPEGRANRLFRETKQEDAESRASFVQRYQQMHRLVREQEGATILYIGAENWPTPIPLVNSGKFLVFRARRQERGRSLYRRVGRNQISA